MTELLLTKPLTRGARRRARQKQTKQHYKNLNKQKEEEEKRTRFRSEELLENEREGLQTVGYPNLVNNFDSIVEDVFFYVERAINGYKIKVTEKGGAVGGNLRHYHVDNPEKLLEESEMPAFGGIEVDKVTDEELLEGIYTVAVKYRLSEDEAFYVYKLFDENEKIFFKKALESFEQRMSVLEKSLPRDREEEKKEICEASNDSKISCEEAEFQAKESEVVQPLSEVVPVKNDVVEAPVVLSHLVSERDCALEVQDPTYDYGDIYNLSFLFDEDFTSHLLHEGNSTLNLNDFVCTTDSAETLGENASVPVALGDVLNGEEKGAVDRTLLSESRDYVIEEASCSKLGKNFEQPAEAYLEVFDSTMHKKTSKILHSSGGNGTSVLGKRSVSGMGGDISMDNVILESPLPKRSFSEKVRGRFADVDIANGEFEEEGEKLKAGRTVSNESAAVREIFNITGDAKIRYTYRPLNLKNLPGALRRLGALLFLISEFMYKEHFSVKGEGTVVICHVSDYDYGEFATLKSSVRAGPENYMNVVRGLNHKKREMFLTEIPKDFLRKILSPMQEVIRRYWCVYDAANIFSIQKVAMLRAAFLRQDFGNRIEPYGLNDNDYLLLHTGAMVEPSRYAYMATEGLFILKTFFEV